MNTIFHPTVSIYSYEFSHIYFLLHLSSHIFSPSLFLLIFRITTMESSCLLCMIWSTIHTKWSICMMIPVGQYSTVRCSLWFSRHLILVLKHIFSHTYFVPTYLPPYLPISEIAAVKTELYALAESYHAKAKPDIIKLLSESKVSK